MIASPRTISSYYTAATCTFDLHYKLRPRTTLRMFTAKNNQGMSAFYSLEISNAPTQHNRRRQTLSRVALVPSSP